MNEPGAADVTIRGRKKMKKWKKVLLMVVGVPLALFIALIAWGSHEYNKMSPEEKATIEESRAVAQSERESRAAEQSRIAAEEAARTTAKPATTNLETKSATTTTIAATESFRPLPVPSYPPETMKSYEFVTYDDLARYPDKWRGKDVTIEGKVIQVVEDGFLRISVTQGDYGVWKNDIIIFGNALNDRNGRILVDDIIIVLGRYDGLTTYTTVLGSSATVPKMWVEKYEYAP
jgi:hypothetical protein